MSRNGMNPLPSLLRASAFDAGARHAEANGRKVWNEDDYNASVAEQNRLIAGMYGRPGDTDARLAVLRFSMAEGMQKDGLLSLATPDYHAAIDAAWAAVNEPQSEGAAE